MILPSLQAATVFIALFINLANGQLCTTGDVRLVGGSSNLEGRVEVCNAGAWGTVCDDGWEAVDANVVCGQLGHAHDDAIAKSGAYFGQGSGSIVLDDVSCSGYEDRLVDCTHRGIGVHDCSHYEDAGVVCVPQPNITFVQNNLTDVHTDIEAIRLVNGDTDYMGRLELLYNGTWGTVCDDFWSYSDAKVACRMLGFEDAVCAVTSNQFGSATSSVPFLIDNIQCLGSEEALDQCSFPGWATNNCSHSTQDAGVVCKSEDVVGIPYNVTLVRSTTKSLTLSWNVPRYSAAAQNLLFFISYKAEAWLFPLSTAVYPSPGVQEGSLITHTIGSLARNTEHDIQIRAQVQYSACSTYTSSAFSDLMTFRSNDTLRLSNISVRLVSPYYYYYSSGVDFLGRVEVLHNGQWGTVCDDYFTTADANVICGMAGFSDAVCIVYSAGFGRGYGQIWLDNIGCSTGDEVLEDCNRLNWGSYSRYCSHSDDVGVICRPNNLTAVSNLAVRSRSTSYIILTWEPYTFPWGSSYSQFEIWYGYIPGSWNYVTVSGSLSGYTLSNLLFEQQYNISVRPKMIYLYSRSNCYYTSIYGPYSSQVSAFTVESAPGGPPSLFNIEAINETAIEALWGLPAPSLRNGIIRGYKLFVQTREQDERIINVTNNSTQAYIIGGLQPRTAYTVSILAYTGAGNGPRSIHLTVVTRTRNEGPLIIGFGINGNNLDSATVSYSSSSVVVHCTIHNTQSSSTTIEWFFANGTRVGTAFGGSNIGVYKYSNGTTALELGIIRRLTYCEGGRYTCVVNTPAGRSERRIFHLLIGSSLPQPSRPTYSRIGGNFITLVWSESFCDGGHEISYFTIRYRSYYLRYYWSRRWYRYYSSYSYRSYSYITVSNPTQRSYQIRGLSPSTMYQFSVQATATDGRISSYSQYLSITTLPTPPSAPRNVVARLVRPLLVQVRWSHPSVTNGVIAQYTIYATPMAIPLQRKKRQISADVIQKVFPGSATFGNITLARHSIFYQFQVTAATTYGSIFNEGSPSSVTASTTIYIPEPGLPKAVNVHISNRTNASLTVRWNYPPPPIGTVIRNFLVTYNGNVEWRSPRGNLVQFEDSGEVTVNDTNVTLFPLVPGTDYLIKVSVISQRGRGEEVSTSGDVLNFRQESLAYFQLRLYPVVNCHYFLDFSENITEKLLNVHSAMVYELARMCPRCHITTSNIRDDEFSCRGGLTNRIVYRAMIIGTTVYSPGDLLSLIQSWVSSGTATIRIPSIRLYIDRDCDIPLDTLRDPDCPPPTTIPVTMISTTTLTKIAESDTTAPTTTTVTENSETLGNVAAGEPLKVRAGTIGGASLAVVIVLLVIVLLIVLIITIVMWKTTLNDNSDDDDLLLPCSTTATFSRESLSFDTDSKEESGL